MIHANLIDAVADLCHDAVKSIELPTENSPSEVVNIFKQYLPPDLFESTEYVPWLLVEWLGTKESLTEGSAAQIGLSIGVYAEKADGYLDAFYIMELLRIQLLSKRTLANKFRLLNEVSWEPAQAQPAPFFVLYGSLSYSVFQPQEATFRHIQS